MATNNNTNQAEATMASKYGYASIKTQTFGVEIETVGLGRRATAQAIAARIGGTVSNAGGYYDKWLVTMADGRAWTCMSDASIGHGNTEIVSPICTYTDIEMVQEVVRAARQAGARVDSRCGIHVHLGAAPFKADPKAIVRLVKIMHKHEDILFEMIEAAGRKTTSESGSGWCRTINKTFRDKVLKMRGNVTLDRLNKAWYGRMNYHPSHYDNTRYHALNLHNIWFRGTVEFRWFDATLHAGKVKSYIQLSLALGAKALETKSASAKKRPYDPTRSKWDGRTTLIRLGLIGDEFKTCRLHLTKHLQGDSRNAPAVAA
jgi:hypothetical protein